MPSIVSSALLSNRATCADFTSSLLLCERRLLGMHNKDVFSRPIVINVPASVGTDVHVSLDSFDLREEFFLSYQLTQSKVVRVVSNINQDGVYCVGVVRSILLLECFDGRLGPTDIACVPHHTLGTCAFLTADPLISRACYHASNIFYADRLASPNGSQGRSDLRSDAGAWNN